MDYPLNRRLLASGLLTLLCLGGCAARLTPPRSPLRTADAIVVLGNRPPVDEAGDVMPETRRRVTHGVRLFHRGLAEHLVFTGGPYRDGIIEADVMRALALTLGVPAQAIRIETTSRDTIGNARETVRLLCERETHCLPSLIIVSSPFHLQRAGRLFECAGARVQLAETPIPDDPGYRRRFVLSERLIRLAYAFIDECDEARPNAAEPAPPDAASSGGSSASR